MLGFTPIFFHLFKSLVHLLVVKKKAIILEQNIPNFVHFFLSLNMEK